VTLDGHGEVVALRTGGRVWNVRLPDGRGRALVQPEPAETADARIHSDPADLYLWLWARTPATAPTVRGDPAAGALRRALLRSTT
jgi:hypothetical protein